LKHQFCESYSSILLVEERTHWGYEAVLAELDVEVVVVVVDLTAASPE
jgi:hypothetical protein